MEAISNETLVYFRQQLAAFVTFTDQEWSIFAEQLYPRTIRKREPLIRHGEICNEIGFILSGSFRFYFLKDGTEISNYFCFPGELISSYYSFLKQAPSFPTIEAMEDARLVCFSHAGLQKLLANELVAPKMERFGRMVAEYLICCYEERLVSFITQNPEERYRQLLQQQPDLLQRIPQHYLANYLGITPVSLSRIRKRISLATTGKNAMVLAS